MNEELQNAINRLNNAITEYEKRQAAKDAAIAIGTALGQAVSIWRSAEQIDGMTVALMDSWSTQVADYEYPEIES